jgi:hypothetical protein
VTDALDPTRHAACEAVPRAARLTRYPERRRLAVG